MKKKVNPAPSPTNADIRAQLFPAPLPDGEDTNVIEAQEAEDLKAKKRKGVASTSAPTLLTGSGVAPTSSQTLLGNF